MDILQTIRDKAQSLIGGQQSPGIQAVISHIEVAERHWLRAKKEREDTLFTDVIYRTNHAFEGALKEAYFILNGKDAAKKTPNEIERFLLENKIFKERVMALFTNYRTEWRNTSTHDYKLFFTEQEAFLAIVSVSAFVHILLDQMAEKISFNIEKTNVEDQKTQIQNELINYKTKPLRHKIRDLFIAFAKEWTSEPSTMTPDREYEWIGFLTGFIASVDPTIDLSSEHKFAHNLRGDIFATFNNEKVVVELKRTRFGKASLNALQNQLSLYMTTGKVDDGIIFVLPDHLPSELKVDEMQIDRDGHKLNIIQITPS